MMNEVITNDVIAKPHTPSMKVSKRRILLGITLIAAGIVWLSSYFGGPLYNVYAAVDDLFVSTNNRTMATEIIEADAALVMDAKAGEVLFYKNHNRQLPPASTTKMMTALIALEEATLNQRISVGQEVNWVTAGESKAGLRPGQLLTWEELIAAMMLPSGNDAARTIAVNIGMKYAEAGSTREEAYLIFVDKMNERAKELGMHDTHFSNPHGMDEPNHYSTAYDLARLAKESMKDERFREMVKNKEFHLPENVSATSGKESQGSFYNRNRLLHPDSEYYYEGAVGIKTGFTDGAGYCLVSSAERDGKQLIAVVLHSTKDEVWTDSHSLLDYGFQQM